MLNVSLKPYHPCQHDVIVDIPIVRCRLERVIERVNGEFQNPIDDFLQSA
jgi:hypothetical protein